MKRRYIAAALLAVIVAIGMTSHAGEKQEAPKKQTHCPVMQQNPVNPKMYVDVQGKRIYVCCPGCITKIKADPEKYIKQMEAEGIVLEQAPAPKEDEKKAE
jgi:uncharacterized Zn-finger protein